MIMRYNMFFRLLFIGLFGIFFFVSCAPDEDPETTAYDVRQKIIGYWKVDEISSEYGQSKYTVKITAGNDSNSVLIDNFYNVGDGKTVTAIVHHNYLMDIPEQSANRFIFKGSATIGAASNQITFSYTADDQGGIVDTVSSTYYQ